MSLTDPDNAKIVAIAHEFQQHADQSHCQAHHKLNTQHAGTIIAMQDVFAAKDEEIPALIITKVIKCTTQQPSAKLKFSCDLFKESARTMKWHTHNPDDCL